MKVGLSANRQSARLGALGFEIWPPCRRTARLARSFNIRFNRFVECISWRWGAVSSRKYFARAFCIALHFTISNEVPVCVKNTLSFIE
jgi:hypothetical protein